MKAQDAIMYYGRNNLCYSPAPSDSQAKYHKTFQNRKACGESERAHILNFLLFLMRLRNKLSKYIVYSFLLRFLFFSFCVLWFFTHGYVQLSTLFSKLYVYVTEMSWYPVLFWQTKLLRFNPKH